jgi:hypothetical protein
MGGGFEPSAIFPGPRRDADRLEQPPTALTQMRAGQTAALNPQLAAGETFRLARGTSVDADPQTSSQIERLRVLEQKSSAEPHACLHTSQAGSHQVRKWLDFGRS